MTVTYTAEVASSSALGCFLKLLLRWRGSIYKLVWKDLLGFLLVYYALNYSYRFILNAEQKRIFEDLVYYCHSYGSLIPLSFVLGFYVSHVMSRWRGQLDTMPGTSQIAMFVSILLHGHDERTRVMRRTIMRYVCLSLTMVMRMRAPRVKKRFPSNEYLIDAGLLLEHEQQAIDTVQRLIPEYTIHWLPIVWATNIVMLARQEGRVRDYFSANTIIKAIQSFHNDCKTLLDYDTISMPLVYTQVVTLTIYAYFICKVIGQQWTTEETRNIIDLHFPIFAVLEFFFFVGWLKVAETMLNPFGDDDDDFEVNHLVDKNLRSSYMIVDEIHHEHPKLIKDDHWEQVLPSELPFDTGSRRDTMPEHSTAKFDK